MSKIIDFFDKLEDYIRDHLSRHPILYTFIGGVAIVLFWRAVWHIADRLEERGGWWAWFFYEPNNLVIVTVVLLATGLFVSYFIGDTILISGLKKDKKVTDKTEREVRDEEARIKEMSNTVMEMKKEVDEIKDTLKHEQKP